jgi:hypothetical protein
MVVNLGPGRNELYTFLDRNDNLEEVLIKGRFLQSDFHDTGCKSGEHMHWYRKILETYNPKTGVVLLSKPGSRRLIKELDTPDKLYTILDLYKEGLAYWKLRETDEKLF